MMKVKTFPLGPLETNCYVVSEPESQTAVVIDAPPGALALIPAFLKENGLSCAALLLTHSHTDHTADAKALKDELKTSLYIHKNDLENLESPGSDGLPLFCEVPPTSAEHLITEGETLTFGPLQFDVIHTPGHTLGGVCFYSPKEGLLFSGDTLFKGSIGRLDFPKADSEAMWTSLKKLEQLPKETTVYPGHGPSTTLGAESWLGQARELFQDR